MAKNEFFVNSAESSRLIYDFVLKSMKEAGVGMPFFPGGLFYAAWFPQPKFYRLHGPGRYGADALGRFLSVCGCICILLSVAVRGKSTFFSAVFSAAALALLIWCYVRIFSRKVAARSEENRKYLSYRTAFSARFGCSKAASARERSMLSSAARAAGRSCASRAARERSASPARAAAMPLKRRPEEEAPPSVKI